MKNNKGISLTEVLVTCGLVAIMGGIAVVNYGSHRDPVEKRQLFQSAKLWSAKVKTCILNVGGWVIEREDSRWSPRPCRVGKGSPGTHKIKFKQRLGWDCPTEKQESDKSEGCFSNFSDHDKFNCLDIRQKKRGTKYQCIVHFNIEKHTEKIYCGTPPTYRTLSKTTCGSDNPSYTDLKEANENKWPEPSNTQQGRGDPANN